MLRNFHFEFYYSLYLELHHMLFNRWRTVDLKWLNNIDRQRKSLTAGPAHHHHQTSTPTGTRHYRLGVFPKMTEIERDFNRQPFIHLRSGSPSRDAVAPHAQEPYQVIVASAGGHDIRHRPLALPHKRHELKDDSAVMLHLVH